MDRIDMDLENAIASVDRRIESDRTPPHSDEAEISVLGGMMLEEAAVDRAMELLTEDDFYHPAHRLIFSAIGRLRDQGHTPDALAVREELKRKDDLEGAGGPEYIARIVDIVPTAANVGYHAKIVLDAAIKRRLIRTGTEIVTDSYEAADDADHLLNRAEERIFKLSEHRFKKAFTPINELLQRAVVELESLAARKEPITGVPTGYRDLDDITAGLQLADLIIVAARPSVGKCLAADSEIVLSDGSLATIEEIVREREAELLTLRDDWTFEWAKPSDFVDDGVKPTFRVRTRSGREIEATASHPFRTLKGWKPLAELAPGARVAVPREIPSFGIDALRDCEVKILAYLIGDGTLTTACPMFTNADRRLRNDFSEAVEDFGGTTTEEHAPFDDRTPALRVVSDRAVLEDGRVSFANSLRTEIDSRGTPVRQVAMAAGVSASSVTAWINGECVPTPESYHGLCRALRTTPEALFPPGLEAFRNNGRNPVTLWLDEMGLVGKGAAEKSVPGPVFRLPRRQMALFLNRLFATDGWASVAVNGGRSIGYSTTSERLARQVQHLLLRFGVVGRLRHRSILYRDERRPAWQIDVTDQRSVANFVERIGIFGKEKAVDRIREVLDERGDRSIRDGLPPEVWSSIGRALGDRSWAWLARRLGYGPGYNFHVGKRGISRKRLAAIAEVLDDEALRDLATGQVYWDEIVSIDYVGEKQVYDLTMPDTHNFVANDVCVHNTSLATCFAANAAIMNDLPVAIFSLEMSTEQLVQRLISMEAMVSLKELRTGHASGEQWKRVADACDRLRRAAIYIDDTGLLTPMEMRAKARRLKQQRDIGMVIVDYLQLMETGSRSESRQQEITEISRSLKALAKELNIPVVALSQLSRAPEQRTDQRPRLSDLRECVTGDTLVVLADGTRTPIRELVGQEPEVLAIDERSRVVRADADKVWSVGVRPVFDVRLASGRRVRATARHRLLTGSGWRRLGELSCGAGLAVVPQELFLARNRSECPAVATRVGFDGGTDGFRAEIDGDVLGDHLPTDLFWDRVVEIVPAGEEEVFDLTVPGPANWLADGIVSHNSGAIEQDADLVLFLYREKPKDDEVQETRSIGSVTEIIVGKNRNGPTGTVELVFLEPYMRFEDLDRHRSMT